MWVGGLEAMGAGLAVRVEEDLGLEYLEVGFAVVGAWLFNRCGVEVKILVVILNFIFFIYQNIKEQNSGIIRCISRR
jgi:hypothetical protein